jgi:hypothetical protein
MKRRLMLSVVAGVVVSAGAHAEDWMFVGQFGWLGVGKAQEIEKGHLFWVGEFSGTFLSDKGENGLFDHAGMKCPGWNDIDLNNKKNKAAGYCVVADAGGDKAYLRWQTTGDTVRGPGTYEWTGGTGKYKDIRGEYPFVGVIQINWPDGTASGYSTFGR